MTPNTGQVVLLHGLLRTPLSMTRLTKRLSKAGYKVYNYGYPSRRFKIAEQAQRLDRYLATKIDRDSPLSFVTHSLGGIVVRRFLLDYGSQYMLGRFVMLGPPNQGSLVAKRLHRLKFPSLILGPALAELAELNLEAATHFMDVGIIAGGTNSKRGISPLLPGDNDAIVAVEETRLHGAKDLLIVNGVHSMLMYQSKVIDQTIHFLEHGSFRR